MRIRSEENKRRALSDCLQHVETHLVQAQPERREMVAGPSHQFMLLMYVRVCNCHRAIRLLLDAGRGDEALALARPEIEEALLLYHMSLVGEQDRNSYFLGYARRGLKELKPVLVTGQQWWPQISATIKMIEGKAVELERWATVQGIRARRIPDGTWLVAKYLREDMAIIWHMSNKMVHGSLAAQFYRLPDAPDQPIGIWTSSPVSEMRETAALATFALATAHNAMADMYDWPAMPDPVDMSLAVLELTDDDPQL